MSGCGSSRALTVFPAEDRKVNVTPGGAVVAPNDIGQNGRISWHRRRTFDPYVAPKMDDSEAVACAS